MHKWLSLLLGASLAAFILPAPAASTADLPASVQLVGREDPVAISTVVMHRPVLLLVCSHATAPLIKAVPAAWLGQGWAIAADQFMGVAAVSRAPWMVKKLFIGAGLKKLVGERHKQLAEQIPDIDAAPVVVDMEGDMAAALQLTDLGKAEYAAFIIEPSGDIKRLLKLALDDDTEAGIDSAANKIVRAAGSYFRKQS